MSDKPYWPVLNLFTTEDAPPPTTMQKFVHIDEEEEEK